MITVRQLIAATRIHKKATIKRAQSVAVRFTKVKEFEDEDGDTVREVYATCMGETVPRKVVMQFIGKGPSAKIWVTCDCPFFLYNYEVALERKDSSDIEHSNGARPGITNPRLLVGGCKHAISCLMNGAANLNPTKKAARKAKKKSKKKK